MLLSESFDEFLGEEVVDPDGHPVGTFACYWEWDTGKPLLLGISCNSQSRRTHVTPVKGVRLNSQQTYVQIPFSRQKVHEAPCLDCDGELDAAFEDRVYAHYGIEPAPGRRASSGSGRHDLKRISPPEKAGPCVSDPVTVQTKNAEGKPPNNETSGRSEAP